MASFFVLGVMFVVLYAIVFMPQQRRLKAHQALVRSLEAGDEVITSSGIHGAIAEVDGDVVWLEVAPDVELKITRSAVAERLTETDTEAGGDDSAEVEDAEA